MTFSEREVDGRTSIAQRELSISNFVSSLSLRSVGAPGSEKKVKLFSHLLAASL